MIIALQVTGSDLVPMTVQKQNAVIAVLEDLMAFAGVWYIRCIAVNQTSVPPGQTVSSANVTIAIQQDAAALYVGQVHTSSTFPHALLT